MHRPCITTQNVETYQDIERFKVGMYHMYIQAKRDHACHWLPTSYKLTSDDVFLIANDWEEEWKVWGEQMERINEEEE